MPTDGEEARSGSRPDESRNPEQDPESFWGKKWLFGRMSNSDIDWTIIVTFIAIMALLRDLVRIYFLEPFAEWKLRRDLLRERGRSTPLMNGSAKEKEVANGDAKDVTNGHANGNGNGHSVQNSPPLALTRKEAARIHRRVLRFAEQGWAFIYYVVYWSFGLVRIHLPFLS